MKEIIAAEVDISFGQSIKSYEEFVRLQGQVKNQIIDLREENKALSKQIRDLSKDETKDLQTRAKLRKQLSEQIAANERQIKTLGQEARRLNTSFDKIDESNGAFKQLTARIRELKNEVKDLRAAGKPVPDSTIQELDALQAKYKEINEEVGDFQFNVGNYQSAFAELGDTIKNRLGDVLSGKSGSLREGIQGLGSDLAAFAGGGGIVAAAVVSIGLLVNVVAQTTLEFQTLRNEVATTTNAIEGDIDTLTVGVRALSETFNVEFSETLRAVNALSAEGLTDGFADSIDLARRAALALGPAFQEGNEQISEFATQAREAGLTGEGLVEVLVRSTREGIFSDKGIDAIKEGGNRIREQTAATTEAVANAFGQGFADRIFQGVNDGSISTIDALKAVSTEIENFEGPASQVQTVIADLFGGAGEDAGRRYLELINDLTGDIDELIPVTDSLTQRNERLFEANVQLAEAQNKIAKLFGDTTGNIQVLGAELKANLFEALSVILEGVDNLFESFSGLFGQFDTGISLADVLTFGINRLADVLKFGFDIVAALISGFAQFINTIREFVSAALEGTKAGGFFANIFEGIKNAISNIPAFLGGVSAGIRQFLDNLFSLDFSTSAFDAYKEEFNRVAEEAKKGAGDIEDTVTGAYARLQQRISELRSQINDYKAAGQDAPKAMVAELVRLEKQLSSVNKSVGSLTETVDTFAKGSIAFLNNQISDLKKRIEETPGLELQIRLQTQINELEAEARQIQARIQRAIDDQAGLTREIQQVGSLNQDDLQGNLQSLISELDLEQRARIENEKETDSALAAIKDAQKERDIQRRADQFQQELALEESFRQRQGELINTQLTNISNLASAFGSLGQARRQAEISEIEARYDRELKLAEGNAEEIERITAERDKEVEKIEREAFQRQKELQIAQALISGFQAVVSTLAAVPGPIDILTLGAARIAQIAFVAATTAAQVAAISKQKFAKGGVLEGPSHERGGVPLFSRSGTYYGEAEGGEPILTKGTSRNKHALGILSHINSRFGGNRIGGSMLPPELAAQLDSYISAGGRAILSAPPPRIMQTGGVIGVQDIAGGGMALDYGRLEQVFRRVISEMPAPVVGIKEFTDAQEEFLTLTENANA